jgi:hypothetical protein
MKPGERTSDEITFDEVEGLR